MTKRFIWLFLTFSMTLFWASLLGEALRYQNQQFVFIGGMTNVAQSGDLFYFTYDQYLQVGRVSDQGIVTPIRQVSYYPLGGRMFIHRGYLLISGEREIVVFDLADPENPQLVNRVPVSYGDIVQENDYLYIARDTGGFEIQYIGDLPGINRVGEYIPEGYETLFTSFDISNGIFYGVLYQYRLQIIDCRDPLQPVLMAEVEAAPLENWIGNMKILGNCLYVTALRQVDPTHLSDFLQVYRIDPGWMLVPTYELPVGMELYGYQVNDDQMIAFEYYEKKIHAFNVSNPEQPVVLNSYHFEGHPDGQAGIGGRWLPPFVIIWQGDEWGAILDGHDIANLAMLNVFQDIQEQYVKRITGNESILAALIYQGVGSVTSLLQDAAPAGITEKWREDNLTMEGIQGNVLFCSEIDPISLLDRYLLYDISQPDAPKLLGSLSNLTGRSICFNGNNTVLLNDQEGAVVYDISRPETPVERCRWKPEGDIFFTYAFVDGERLYVCDATAGQFGFTVWVVDISDVQNPQVLQSIDDRFNLNLFVPQQCLVYQSHLLIVRDASTIKVVDINDIQNPNYLQNIQFPYSLLWNPIEFPENIHIFGRYLISAMGGAGLWFHDLGRIPDVNDSAFVGYIPTLDSCNDAWVGDGIAYLATQSHVVKSEFRIIGDGDLNEDGSLTSDDLQLMANYLSESDTFTMDPWVGDLNYDGKIDIRDLYLLHQQILPTK